jgi:hypothetical protein
MKRMSIVEYVKRNYTKLPKSSFNTEEVVVVLEMRLEWIGGVNAVMDCGNRH